MLRIITRSDDAGSSRSANAAILKAAQGAFVKNISLMAPGAYIDEAAQMLKEQKHICFGMHFTMNAEWDNVKWGPVCQKLKGTAMTDEHGYFHAEPSLSCEHGADIEMIHTEWNAQLDKLTALGFDIRYADTHMFPELAFEGLADAMSGWIREKGLVDHRYFYHVLPQIDEISSTDGLFEKVLAQTAGGQYFYLTHPAMPLEEMYLTGNRSNPTEKIVEGRKKDMDFVVSPTTIQLCEKYHAEPIRYDEAKYSEADKNSIKQWRG